MFDFSGMGDQNTPASRKSHVSKDFKKLGFTVRIRGNCVWFLGHARPEYSGIEEIWELQ